MSSGCGCQRPTALVSCPTDLKDILYSFISEQFMSPSWDIKRQQKMQYKMKLIHMTLTGSCLQEPRNAVTRQKVTTTKYNSFRASNTNLSRAYPCLSWHRVRQERVVTHGHEEEEEEGEHSVTGEKSISNLLGEIFGEVCRPTRPGEQIANSYPASFALASASSMQPSPASHQLVRIAFATR